MVGTVRPCIFRGREAMEGTPAVKVNKKLVSALCGGTAVLLAVSGCGSNETGKKQDAWAKGVCDQAAAQFKKIDDANTALSHVDGGGTAKAVKSADSTAFASIAAADKSLAAIFSDAGAAPGGDGAKFEQGAVSAFTGLSAQYAGLQKQVDGLSTSDSGKFAAGLKNVSASLDKTTTSGEKAMSALRQGDMGKALAKQPGCQRVSGTATPATTS